jgi:hypothetical protein
MMMAWCVTCQVVVGEETKPALLKTASQGDGQQRPFTGDHVITPKGRTFTKTHRRECYVIRACTRVGIRGGWQVSILLLNRTT